MIEKNNQENKIKNMIYNRKMRKNMIYNRKMRKKIKFRKKKF